MNHFFCQEADLSSMPDLQYTRMYVVALCQSLYVESRNRSIHKNRINGSVCL